VKSAGAIKHKLNQVRFRHMKKRIEAELRRAPGNCTFNAVVQPPTSPDGEVRNGHGFGVGLCLYGAGDPSTWKPTFCDERVDGGARAKDCGLFCPRKSKDRVKEEFRRELDGMTLPEVAFRYPDMAALIWVLDEEDIPEVEADEGDREDTPPSEDETPEPVAAIAPPPQTELVPVAPERRPWWARWILGRLS
jgi:hypothetical protein